jgi:hypothetical protein
VPEYAAAQETLANAVHLEEEYHKLVVAVLMVDREAPQLARVCYWHSVITAYRATSIRRFEPGRALHAPTLHTFHRHVAHGWVPVAITFGDDSPDCSFLLIHAGIAITGADLGVVYTPEMTSICVAL